MPTRPAKLNLGAHGTRIRGFLNVDLLPETRPDVVGNLLDIEFKDGSLDEIYISHTLEHFNYGHAQRLLEKFHRWLVPGGIMWLAVPDFEKLCAIVTAGEGDTDYIRGLFYGGSEHDTDCHRSGWTRAFLRRTLEERGYAIAGTWDAFVQNEDRTGSDFAGVWFEYADGRREPLSLNWKCVRVP